MIINSESPVVVEEQAQDVKEIKDLNPFNNFKFKSFNSMKDLKCICKKLFNLKMEIFGKEKRFRKLET